jgi:hypothetical protein
MTAYVGKFYDSLLPGEVVIRDAPEVRIGYDPLGEASGGGTTMKTYWLNRGRTAAGVCAEWTSEGVAIDTVGAFYVPGPPWVDIVEVIGLRTWVA